MKMLIALLLCLTLVFSLAACSVSKNDAPAAEEPAAAPAEAPAAEEPAAEEPAAEEPAAEPAGDVSSEISLWT